MTQTAAVQQIKLVDKRLDEIRLEVFRRIGRFNSQSADCWDLAWGRCPDLYARHCEFYRQRGALQKLRDEAIERKYRAERRLISSMKCKACGRSRNETSAA